MDTSPPRTYDEFCTRFPGLAQAWEALGTTARACGPLRGRDVSLLKFALAVGAGLEGAVHSAARKALAADVDVRELEQVIALAASTLGLPRTVAAWTWLRDVAGDPGSGALAPGPTAA